MTQAIQDQIDADKKRRARIESQHATMTSTQKAKWNEIKHQLELAQARLYQHRLNADIAAYVVEGAVLDPRVICTLAGGIDEMPTTPHGWDDLAREMTSAAPLAMRSVESSDSELKKVLRQEILDSMPVLEKMSKGRKGVIDSYLDDEVQKRLNARAGL